jgi:hypothetical protein
MGFMNDKLSCVEILKNEVIVYLYPDSEFGGEPVKLDHTGKFDLRDYGIDDKVSSYTVTHDGKIPHYTITATAGEGGTVSGSGSYGKGEYVTLTAMLKVGYAFDGWYENDVKIQSAYTYTFMAETDRTLVARFVSNIIPPPDNPSYIIAVTASEGGTVTGNGSYAAGASVTLTATPNTGYSFGGWYENGAKIGSAGAVYTFTATSNRTLEARFVLNDPSVPRYAITATAGTGGTATGGGSYAEGASVTLKATPNSGYSFGGWYENGVKIESAGVQYTFTVASNRTLVAQFTYVGKPDESEGGGGGCQTGTLGWFALLTAAIAVMKGKRLKV